MPDDCSYVSGTRGLHKESASAITQIVRSRRGRLVSRFGKNKGKLNEVNAEHAPEDRLPGHAQPETTLGSHVVASLGSYGVRVGGQVSVRNFRPFN